MQAITLSIPPNINVNLDEDLIFLQKSNPHLHIERVGENQVSVIPNTDLA